MTGIWRGRSSLGTSGNNDATEASLIPGIGPQINHHPSVQLTTKSSATKQLVLDGTMDDYLSINGFSGCVVIKPVQLAVADLFEGGLVHFWGDNYSSSTGTWPDAVAFTKADADDEAYAIPTVISINGHLAPTFNGVDQALVTGILRDLDYRTTYCVFACLKNNETPSSGGIIAQQTAQFAIELTPAGKVYAFINNGNKDITSTISVNDNVWHRVILNVVDNVATLYIDGVADGTATFTPLPAAVFHTWIGLQANGSTFFKGSLAAIGVSKTACSDITLLDDLLTDWTTESVDATNPFNEAQILASNPDSILGLSHRRSQVRLWMQNAGLTYNQVIAVALPNQWHLIQFYFTGSVLGIRSEFSSTWTTTACTPLVTSYAGQTLKIGHGVGAFGKRFYGVVEEIMLSKQVFTSAMFDRLKWYFNTRYATYY